MSYSCQAKSPPDTQSSISLSGLPDSLVLAASQEHQDMQFCNLAQPVAKQVTQQQIV